MNNPDYYKILELDNSDKELNNDDFNKKLKTNYRRLSKKYHPDKNQGDKEAEEEFKKVSEAYGVLSNTEKRNNYDRFGGNKIQQQYNNRKHVRVGGDMTLLIKITLEEVYSGTKKRYKYHRNDSCKDCNGHGGYDNHNCGVCGGNGVVIQAIETPIGYIRQVIPCQTCEGIGLVYKNKCEICNGKGINQIEEIIEIDVPSGIQEGMTIIMEGRGNSVKSGVAGNLQINVMVLPHDTYIRNGSDLKMNINLTYSQLVLGDKIDVNTIDGGKIRVTIPKHSNVGSNLRVQNKGLKPFEKDIRGDVVIILGIIIPKEINERTKEILNELKNIEQN
jgi:molecular chaperone DnaJ